MRLKGLRLSWFRGAGPNAPLELHDRSAAVYGANGSGKSSFVDALEYVLNSGRIQHLAHEYSGRHQERAVLNTHKPANASGEILVQFADGSDVTITINSQGSHSVTGSGAQHLLGWDYRRTVLRQDEVSRFVHSTKGEKYSVLLPLLGLGHLETIAENLRQLGAAVRKQSGAQEAAGAIRTAQAQFEAVFGAGVPKGAHEAIRSMCTEFVGEAHEHSGDRCADLIDHALAKRLANATELQRIQLAVEDLARLDVRKPLADVRAAATRLAHLADGLVQAQLEVLRSSTKYLGQVEPSQQITCPTCGSIVSLSDMKKHVDSEAQRLDAAVRSSHEYRSCKAGLAHVVQRGIDYCGGTVIQEWARTRGPEAIAAIERAARVVPLSDAAEELELQEIEKGLIPAVVAAAASLAFLPPPATELARARERLLTARGLMSAERTADSARLGSALADAIQAREAKVRNEIRSQSAKVIGEITDDVQRLWKMLHPLDLIEDVCLKVPQDTDKAIDVALKFYGKDLESPRLTLSEGYRNSLGLCVFLAMAARDKGSDNPIVLDDVIVSLDRAHRGMVAKLIVAEFSARQVLLFTHDRDWYSDLRHQLPSKEWRFSALLPYPGPQLGISWSERTSTLGDARAYLATRADTAANEARKVMDVELAIRVEKLGLELAFMRGEKNDRRGAHEFLESLIAQGQAAFKRKDAQTGKHVKNSEALTAFAEADRLLMSWANRGSHSEDVERVEAEELIKVCEAALNALQCDACGKAVTYAESGSSGAMQCECGSLRWK